MLGQIVPSISHFPLTTLVPSIEQGGILNINNLGSQTADLVLIQVLTLTLSLSFTISKMGEKVGPTSLIVNEIIDARYLAQH